MTLRPCGHEEATTQPGCHVQSGPAMYYTIAAPSDTCIIPFATRLRDAVAPSRSAYSCAHLPARKLAAETRAQDPCICWADSPSQTTRQRRQSTSNGRSAITMGRRTHLPQPFAFVANECAMAHLHGAPRAHAQRGPRRERPMWSFTTGSFHSASQATTK